MQNLSALKFNSEGQNLDKSSFKVQKSYQNHYQDANPNQKLPVSLKALCQDFASSESI